MYARGYHQWQIQKKMKNNKEETEQAGVPVTF
jgi:hypothetical protein